MGTQPTDRRSLATRIIRGSCFPVGLVVGLIGLESDAPAALTAHPSNPVYQTTATVTSWLGEHAALVALGIVAVVLCGFLPWHRLINGLTDPVLARIDGHRDQFVARQTWPFYANGTLQKQMTLLEMSTRELCIRSGLSLSTIKFVLRRPDILPRPEHIPDLLRGLMLPPRYFERGIQYGKTREYSQATIDRLRRYQEQKRAGVYTAELQEELTIGKAAELLAKIECQLNGVTSPRLKP